MSDVVLSLVKNTSFTRLPSPSSLSSPSSPSSLPSSPSSPPSPSSLLSSPPSSRTNRSCSVGEYFGGYQCFSTIIEEASLFSEIKKYLQIPWGSKSATSGYPYILRSFKWTLTLPHNMEKLDFTFNIHSNTKIKLNIFWFILKMTASVNRMNWFDVRHKGENFLKGFFYPKHMGITPSVASLIEFMSIINIHGMTIMDLVSYLLICCGIFNIKK